MQTKPSYTPLFKYYLTWILKLPILPKITRGGKTQFARKKNVKENYRPYQLWIHHRYAVLYYSCVFQFD